MNVNFSLTHTCGLWLFGSDGPPPCDMYPADVYPTDAYPADVCTADVYPADTPSWCVPS